MCGEDSFAKLLYLLFVIRLPNRSKIVFRNMRILSCWTVWILLNSALILAVFGSFSKVKVIGRSRGRVIKMRPTGWKVEEYCKCQLQHGKKVKVAHTRLPSVGFRSWYRFLAVSLQVTWVINPAVGHYCPPGLQLPSQPLRGLLPISLLGEQGHNAYEYKTVTRQRRDCDLNPGPFAPESSTLTTRLPSHPTARWQKSNRKWKL